MAAPYFARLIYLQRDGPSSLLCGCPWSLFYPQPLRTPTLLSTLIPGLQGKRAATNLNIALPAPEFMG